MQMEIINSQVPHKYRNRFLRDSGGGGNVSLIGGSSAGSRTIRSEFEPHNLWGQYFDDTQDIDGDLSGVGDITATGDITTEGDISANNIAATGNISATGNVTANNVTATSNVSASGITATTANLTTVNSTTVNNSGTITTDDLSATTGKINEFDADTANITTVNSTTVNSTDVNASNGNITNMVSSDMVTEYLTVTKEAHFFKLIIDELRSVGGQVILTAANATLDDVEQLTNGSYRCYFKAKDATNDQIANQFIINDQVICQTFNVAVGTSYNVSNKYYWRLVVGKGKTDRTIDGVNTECHYIDLSNTTKDGTSIPEKGDKIAQLGYRGTDDTPRQSAIIISAYQSVDVGLTPPYYAQYRGINDFSLSSHRYSWFATNSNQIRGNLKIDNGTSVQSIANDAITSAVQQSKTYTDGQITTVNNSISQIRQTAESITSSVESLNDTTESHTSSISQLRQTADSLSSTVQSHTTILSNIEFAKKVRIDASTLSESYAYPVAIDFKTSNDPNWIRCKVFKTLSTEYGTCSYSRHNTGSIELLLDWYTKSSAWGTTLVNQTWSESDTTRYIEDYNLNWSNEDKVVGSIGQCTQIGVEIVYVRGGSQYDVYTSFGDADITLYPNGYTWTSDVNSESYSAPRISISSLVVPIVDKLRKSEIIQTATNIQLNVYDELLNKTGIDVSQGKITLDADNTTIVGNLNLTDTSNGMTVYDNDGIPRINLQPEAISTIATLSNDTYNYYTMSKSVTAAKYDVTTNELSFALTQYETVDIDKFTVTMYSSGNSTQYPSSYYMDVEVIITHPDTTTTSKSLTTNRVDSYGRYQNMTSKVRFTAPTAGTYTIKCRVKTTYDTSLPSGNTTCYAMVNARLQAAKSAQTYIGKDGFYTHAGANKLIWAGETETQIRYGFNGIRWNDADAINNTAMEVLANVTGSAPNLKPLWLPFYNYVPLTAIGSFDFTLTNFYIPTSTTKYAYQINPTKIRGVLVINAPAFDSQGNEQSESWIILPNPSFTYNGVSAALPAGYTITIINHTNKNVYVTPYRTSTSTATIIDANRDQNNYCGLNGVQTRDTYIFTGGNHASTGETWLAMHDTQ